ncbi:pur operon repressor [Clostridium paraputrificum]|uniref:pur operon repressor n=1 Tax=Clostridium paraputrificum TaxID=29363 RepID=UPI0006C2B745|nr:pur operon repressor [Clostridium paraputrificum]CUO70932.1 pur operon repressor [Clostridium paraputrificum]
MEKLSRNSRVVAITKLLLENPNKILGLNQFSDLLNAAKSTISEDIVIIRELLEKLEMGRVETISGEAGGIKFIPIIGYEKGNKFALELCDLLKDDGRVIAGNFIYVTDVMYNPQIIGKAGVILSSCFKNMDIDYVITVETKGIPLAYEVARNLGVQLVIARRDTQVTEGPTVTINYVSGTSGRLQQMSLSKRSMKPSSKCIFIDDFMKGGGTAQGIKDLLKEFDSELVGIGVLIDNKQVEKKLVDDYVSIVELNSVDKSSIIEVQPSEMFS